MRPSYVQQSRMQSRARRRLGETCLLTMQHAVDGPTTRTAVSPNLEVVSADAHHPGGRHGVAAGSTFYIWLGLANLPQPNIGGSSDGEVIFVTGCGFVHFRRHGAAALRLHRDSKNQVGFRA